MSDPATSVFATLAANRRTWAIGSIHGEADKLRALHGQLSGRSRSGDSIVYLGNMLGRGADVAGTVDEVLHFRRAFMARRDDGRHVDSEDIVFLRGAQEEMWHKLLQIQFAPNPSEVFQWMLDQGVGATIEAYGASVDEGRMAAREGAFVLTQWTNRLRDTLRARDGHTPLMSALKRAAYTADNALLFVNAGVDASRPLSEQADAFWWAGQGFDALEHPYGGFFRVIRGFARARPGLVMGDHTASLDGGAGFGGTLIAACFGPDGALLDSIEV